jgi:hypothetical protein
MTDKGLRQYIREIEQETDVRNLQYIKRFWQDEGRRMNTGKYQSQCVRLANLAGQRLLDLYEYHGEGTA